MRSDSININYDYNDAEERFGPEEEEELFDSDPDYSDPENGGYLDIDVY